MPISDKTNVILHNKDRVRYMTYMWFLSALIVASFVMKYAGMTNAERAPILLLIKPILKKNSCLIAMLDKYGHFKIESWGKSNLRFLSSF